ncbi:MAG: four helix bundle protein [Terriglobia bacterium]
MRKAATSIPANIAEGWGRGTTNDYLRFLAIARGSLMELETHSIVAQGLGFMSPDQLKQTSGKIEEIGRMLNGLIQALKEPKNQAAVAQAGVPNS